MLRVGDSVIIKNTGLIYSTYRDMATRMNLKYFNQGLNPRDVPWFSKKETVAKVIAVKPHMSQNNTICVGIRISRYQKNYDFIIKNEGLIRKNSFLMSNIDKSLFEI